MPSRPGLAGTAKDRSRCIRPVMHFYPGKPIHFYSGVDSDPPGPEILFKEFARLGRAGTLLQPRHAGKRARDDRRLALGRAAARSREKACSSRERSRRPQRDRRPASCRDRPIRPARAACRECSEDLHRRHVRHVPCRRRPPTTPLRRIEGIFVLIPRRPPARNINAPPLNATDQPSVPPPVGSRLALTVPATAVIATEMPKPQR